jgi:thiamine biosynthesis lipoprotein
MRKTGARFCATRSRLERARPLLGTTVAVAVGGLAQDAAHAAIDAAFAEVARVHALMSFQEPDSDVSRLNREAAARPVRIDPLTFETLRKALRLADLSDGAFDPTLGAALVAAGVLPETAGAPPADRRASWRDVTLDTDDGSAFFARPLRLDLCGIAKGFAVDRAIEALRRAGATSGVVNAGGDLRVFGAPERVALCTGLARPAAAPILELEEGAAASSGSLDPDVDETPMALHLAGRSRRRLGGRFACVSAPECVWADGLTKVVLACGPRATPVLAAFGARAYALGPGRTWRSYGLAG